MNHEQVHRTVSSDGTEIVGRVHGEGPALVLIHGGIGDGDIAWEALLPHLVDRFTCYLPSTRGRGLSSDNPDHSPARLEEDVLAFVESIGEPVAIVGWSGSGAWVLGAAARSHAVVGVAAFEPFVLPVMRAGELARTVATMERMGAATADGRLADAIRTFAAWICTDVEIAALEETGFYGRWAGCVPAMLRFVQQDGTYDGPRSTDPEALDKVTVPVLLMHGHETALSSFIPDAVQYIATHVSQPEVRGLTGVGHFAPLLAPERIARELTSFFAGLLKEPSRQLE